MSEFKIHDIDTAPEGSKPLLKNSVAGFGMIPNLHGVMAESPAVLEAYQRLHGLAQQTAFDKEQLTVVWQCINVEHRCHYCVPAHSMIAGSMKVDPRVTEALRNETELPTKPLNVLRDTTLAIVRNRGVVDEAVLKPFHEAGFTRQHQLEIVLILAQKVMSNYINHFAETPIDEPFAKFAWSKSETSTL